MSALFAKIVLASLSAATAAALLKRFLPEYQLLLNTLFCVVALAVIIPSVISAVTQLVGFVPTSLALNYGVLTKTVCIAIISRAAGNICADAGQQSLCMCVELCGRLLILTAALPVFQQILTAISGILE